MKNKTDLIKLSIDETTDYSLKNKVFSGKILLIKNSKEIIKIIELTEQYFNYFFKANVIKFKKKKINYDIETSTFFEIIQNRIKFCKLLRKYFANFLFHIGLDINSTYMDNLSFRFSPGTGRKKIGKLIPTPAHRDTWASNIFNQINFWFPIHNVSVCNSIFFVPKYFNKKVENDSDIWSFDQYKKTNKLLSTPVSNIKFSRSEMISFNIKKGEVLCFSGHHIHGSLLGQSDRLNLETRIVCKNDEEVHKIPLNLDAKGTTRKNMWFKNLKNGKSYI